MCTFDTFPTHRKKDYIYYRMEECCYYHCRISGSVVSRLRSRLQQGHSIWPQWHWNNSSSDQHQDGHNGNVLGHLQGWVCGGLARCLLQVVEVMTGHIQSTWKPTIFSFYCPGITINSPSASFVYEWWWSPKPNIELMDFLLLAAPGLWTMRKNLSETACWFLLLLLKYHIALLCP